MKSKELRISLGSQAHPGKYDRALFDFFEKMNGENFYFSDLKKCEIDFSGDKVLEALLKAKYIESTEANTYCYRWTEQVHSRFRLQLEAKRIREDEEKKRGVSDLEKRLSDLYNKGAKTSISRNTTPRLVGVDTNEQRDLFLEVAVSCGWLEPDSDKDTALVWTRSAHEIFGGVIFPDSSEGAEETGEAGEVVEDILERLRQEKPKLLSFEPIEARYIHISVDVRLVWLYLGTLILNPQPGGSSHVLFGTKTDPRSAGFERNKRSFSTFLIRVFKSKGSLLKKVEKGVYEWSDAAHGRIRRLAILMLQFPKNYEPLPYALSSKDEIIQLLEAIESPFAEEEEDIFPESSLEVFDREEMLGRITSLEEENASLKAENTSLKEEIASLLDKISRLKSIVVDL